MEAITVTHVGMDVHAQSIEYSVRLPGTVEIRRLQSEHSDSAVRGVFKRLRSEVKGPIRACYEAGPTGFGLQRMLMADGIDCAVVAPSLIPRRPGERCKTDRKDARMLRELDEAGLLRQAHVPTRAEEGARALTRKLERARHGVTRAKVQIRGMLLRLSIVQPKGTPWTKTHRQWLERLELEQPSEHLVLEDSLLELAHCEQRQAKLEGQVAVLADTEPFAAKVKALRCFKGIDTAAAMGLATELISPERFLSGREVMSYAGLSIVEYSSGESQRRSGITKSGNAHLRRVLVRASQHARKPVTRESKALQVRRKAAPAWAAELGRRAERRLHEKHRGLVNRGKPENVAVTAVARELAGWIWACMMHDIQASAAGPTGVSADGVSLT